MVSRLSLGGVETSVDELVNLSSDTVKVFVAGHLLDVSDRYLIGS